MGDYLRPRLISITIASILITLTFSASANDIDQSNRYTLHVNDGIKPTIKYRTATKIATFNLGKSEVKQTETPDPKWEKIGSPEEWNYVVEDEEWGKIGKINQKITFYKLKYDKSDRYDWYAVVWQIQVIPGKEAYHSDFATMDIYNWVDGDRYRSYTKLIDYGPYSTSGSTTVSFNVGVTAGMDGAQVSAFISVSYTVKDINVHDQSDFSENLAKWWHDVNECTVGSYTVTIKPSMVFRVPQSKSMHLNFTTKVKFGRGILCPGNAPVVPPSADIFIQTLYFEIPYIYKNYEPDTPPSPSGPTFGKEGETYEFSVRTVDPDWDQIRYEFCWGDGKTSLTDWYPSSTTVFVSHKWEDKDTSDDIFSVKVRAIDKNGKSSEWSNVHTIIIKDRDKDGVSKYLSISDFYEKHLWSTLFQILSQLRYIHYRLSSLIGGILCQKKM